MWMLHLSVWNWNGFCNKISSVIRPNPSETHSTIQFETIENSLCPFHLIIIRWKGTEKSCLFNDQRVPLWKLQFRPSYNTHPQPSCVFVVVSLKIISPFERDRSFNYGLCSTGSVWSDSFSTGAQFLRRACSRSNCPKCGKCSDCHLGTPLRLPGCRIARLSGCQVTFFPLSDKTLLLIWTDFWSHALLCHIWPKPHCFIGLFDLFTETLYAIVKSISLCVYWHDMCKLCIVSFNCMASILYHVFCMASILYHVLKDKSQTNAALWHFQSISQQSNQIRGRCIGLVIFPIQSGKKCKTQFLNLISSLYLIPEKL